MRCADLATSRPSAGCERMRNRSIHFRLRNLEDRLPTAPDPTWQKLQAKYAAMSDAELKAALKEKRAELLAQLEAETQNGKSGKWI
jgi:hypothetical protein